MKLALSIATTCKPFRGDAARIQRNALASWANLSPRPEVLVFGDEPGVAEACAEFGARQVPKVERSTAGTPLLSGLVEGAEREARSQVLALVNADILLTSGLHAAVERVSQRFDRWLLIARRWNLDFPDELDAGSQEWEERLMARARRDGVLEPPFGGVDVFVFPRGVWGEESLPPFAIGRGRWDSAILFEARRRGLAVVDATDVVPNVHQNHDYSHHPHATQGVFKGPEAIRNEALLGGEEFIFSALDATHRLDARGLRRNRVWHPMFALRKLATLPALHPALAWMRPAVRAAAPLWRHARRFGNAMRQRRQALASATSDRAQRRTPYPSTVSARPRYPTDVPPGGGVEDFAKPEAAAINRARLDHLASLDLPLEGRRVLDVGAGPGLLAQSFVERGCQVVCLEGRKENVERMHQLHPDLDGRVFDVEADDWSSLGRFDVVFCYGLLYHVQNPFRLLRNLGSVCGDLLLLSTAVADHRLPLVVMEEETASYTQALENVGCRPTPSFVALALRSAGFNHVYGATTPPDHPDFQFSWRNDLSLQRDGHLIRCTFVASRAALDRPGLVDLLQRTD